MAQGKETIALSKTVLVVEDDELSQFVIVEMCRELGFTCLTANDGAQAIDMIEENAANIGVVLMDIHMPKVSGLDATTMIRSKPSDPPKNLPVVATTADEEWHNPKRCCEFGFNSVLPKPVSLSQLNLTLQRFSA